MVVQVRRVSLVVQLLVTALGILITSQALAMGVSPLVMELSSIGTQSRSNMTVSNPADTPLSLELVVERLSMAPNGRASYVSADDDVLIFPPFAQIAAGGTQQFQLQYIGEPELPHSQAYRVAVTHVPVALREGDGAQLSVVSTIEALLTISPPGAKASLEVVAIKPSSETSGDWQVRVRNNGNRHARISESTWSITSGNSNNTYNSREIQSRTKGDLVLPGMERLIEFTPPEGLKPGATAIQISSDKKG